MSNNENAEFLIVKKIQQMAELLILANHPHWGRRLIQISHLPIEDGSMIQEIISLYGGMGSLNDLVLYIEGNADARINDEFDALRTAVYELCYRHRSI